MKNKKEEEKKLNELTPQMVERITIMTQTLAQMKATGKTVNEQTIKELDNLISELFTFTRFRIFLFVLNTLFIKV